MTRYKIRERTKNVIVNVKVPQSTGNFKKDVGGFLFANPIVAIIIIIAGLALLIIFGGLLFNTAFEMLLDPWRWALCLLVVLAFKPRDSTVIGFAAIIGLLFWGIVVYQEWQLMQNICQVPLIGWIYCKLWDIGTFVPKMALLGLNIMISFAMVWIGEFIRYEATK